MIACFETRGRRWGNVFTLTWLWALLLALVVWVDASVWFVGAIALFTLPLLYDVMADVGARLEVHPGRLVWTSMLRSGAEDNIDHVRLVRRWDGRLSISIVRPDHSRVWLPPDLVAPLTALETALEKAGLSAERHPFTLW